PKVQVVVVVASDRGVTDRVSFVAAPPLLFPECDVLVRPFRSLGRSVDGNRREKSRIDKSAASPHGVTMKISLASAWACLLSSVSAFTMPLYPSSVLELNSRVFILKISWAVQ